MKTCVLPYEEAAEQVTVSGWACKTCHQWYGNDVTAERVARYCCAKDRPCDCGARISKSEGQCVDCREAAWVDRWAKLKRVPWDGKAALFSERDNRFFFSPDELEQWTAEDVESLRFRICEPIHGATFDLVEHIQDELPDDDDCHFLDEEGKSAEAAVNAWIEKQGALSWQPGDLVPTTESITGEAKAIDGALEGERDGRGELQG